MSRTGLTVIGVLVGAAIGWFTAPTPAVDIRAGGVSIQVQGDNRGGTVTAGEPGGGMQVQIGQPGGFLPDPLARAAVFGLIGGIAGFGLGSLRGRAS